MISKTKSTLEISDRTTREYYLLIDGHKVMGVSTTIIEARACAEIIAQEKKAGKIEGEDLWIYHDESGVVKTISVEPARKLRVKR